MMPSGGNGSVPARRFAWLLPRRRSRAAAVPRRALPDTALTPGTVFSADCAARVLRSGPSGAQTASVPQGCVLLRWTDAQGRVRTVEIVAWKRLDDLLPPGTVLTVMVEGRAAPVLALPLQQVQARVRLTGDREDVAEVAVGDVTCPDGWRFGVQFHGAVPEPAS